MGDGISELDIKDRDVVHKIIDLDIRTNNLDIEATGTKVPISSEIRSTTDSPDREVKSKSDTAEICKR